MPTATEITLDFRLPEAQMPLRPTAQVRWTGVHPKTGKRGMGMRFVQLDRSSTSHIDNYVYARSGSEAIMPPSPLPTD